MDHTVHAITCWHIFNTRNIYLLITVAVRSKALTVFARSNNVIMSSNPTQGMDLCLHILSVFVLSYVGGNLAMG
jgi:hypothetical protein